MQRLIQKLEQDKVPADLRNIITTIISSCKEISFQLRQGALAGIYGSAEQENIQGETQKKLDVISNNILKKDLSDLACIKGFASEEEDDPVAANEDGEYLVMFDPLDGSSNIEINVSVGTIFSILRAPHNCDTSRLDPYLQVGRQQLASGFVLYGPAVNLILTTGKGVDVYTLNQYTGEFVLTREKVMIPTHTQEFAINMSNYRFWEEPMRNYIDDLLKGEEGPMNKRYNMRWVASMVAEVYRVLYRSGIFSYPWDSREPEKAGKLRLMYEANPMAFIVEQAGGLAWTDKGPILDVQPENIHQRVPVILGSKDEVETCLSYHNEK